VMSLRDKVPMAKWVAMIERVLLKDPDWRNAPYVWKEKPENVYKYASFAASLPDKIMNIREYIEWLIKGVKDILENLTQA